jgi:hypothetical protein
VRFLREKGIVFLVTLILLIGTACNGNGADVTTIPPSTALPAQDNNILPPDDAETLQSLEKVDNYPFFVMHYTGDYEYPQLSLSSQQKPQFACSLFANLREVDDLFYGRNFDWDYSPALLLFTDPSDGYASVSMVDLTFLGINPVDSSSLQDLPLTERTELLTAPSMPFDGMNEYGLTIGMAAVPDEFQDDASFDSSRPTIGSIGIIREVLDHARNVEEAVTIFQGFNIDFRGGPPIHYLIADPSGRAILIEFYQGEMVLLYNDSPWHIATNHLRCTAEGDGGCMRYRTLALRLSQAQDPLDSIHAMQLLSAVDQDNTQWSSVYDMTSGDVHIAIGRNYETIYNFHLDLASP